jgi:hypothetical protein
MKLAFSVVTAQAKFIRAARARLVAEPRDHPGKL